VWQQIFRKHLDLTYEPNEIDLLRAVHSIIDNCQDTPLRNKVLKLVANKKFTQKLEKWYSDLKNEKILFNSYLPYTPSRKETEKIIKLEKIDCSNNIAVIDLKPLEKLIYLKEINCSNTYISDLSTLSKLNDLEKINLNYTKIDTLNSLAGLSKLKIVDCYGTDLTQHEIELFSIIRKDCEVISESFLTSENLIKGKRK
jgi:Leucine-rich repeat (LRR) protein